MEPIQHRFVCSSLNSGSISGIFGHLEMQFFFCHRPFSLYLQPLSKTLCACSHYSYAQEHHCGQAAVALMPDSQLSLPVLNFCLLEQRKVPGTDQSSEA